MVAARGTAVLSLCTLGALPASTQRPLGLAGPGIALVAKVQYQAGKARWMSPPSQLMGVGGDLCLPLLWRLWDTHQGRAAWKTGVAVSGASRLTRGGAWT